MVDSQQQIIFAMPVFSVIFTKERIWGQLIGRLENLSGFSTHVKIFGEIIFDSYQAMIQPLTDIGEVTVRILDFNSNERIIERQALIAGARYPSALALGRMTK